VGSVGTPLRLFKSPDGGPFNDITEDVLPGSVRTRGRTGGFSDFLIVTDLRAHADVADDKYLFLVARLANPAIAPATRLRLETLLASSRSAFDAADYAGARAALLDFESAVRTAAGGAVPNRWRSARDLDNIAGDLLGESASLRFTLAGCGPEPGRARAAQRTPARQRGPGALARAGDHAERGP
jgi:hypothetical protein